METFGSGSARKVAQKPLRMSPVWLREVHLVVYKSRLYLEDSE